MKTIVSLLGLLVLGAVVLYGLNTFIYNQKLSDVTENQTPMNPIKVTPITHASLVLNAGNTVIYADPVDSPDLYASASKPDIILVTHEHADHFSTSTLSALVGSSTTLVVPQSVADKLPANLKTNLVVMKNGDTKTINGVSIEAVPAYNIRQDALKFHPKGRDNGYVVTTEGKRIYIAGDTEGTPEMRALQNIDIAFLPMNLPYTMSVEDAAAAVLAFKPKQVYPYHYRGADGLSDVNSFKTIVAASDPNIEVILANWYPAAE